MSFWATGKLATWVVIPILLASCGSMAEDKAAPMSAHRAGISRQAWGHTPSGAAVDLYTLRNAAGIEVRVATYGGTIVGLVTPDRAGHMADIVLGFDSIEGYTNATYLGEGPYFGALIGRYGNRIGRGQFQLDGTTYRLATNNGTNHLHGGTRGFDKGIWTAKANQGAEPSLELKYTSSDGEEGYPGKLDVTVIYTLTGKNELTVAYTAVTDRDTVLNLTTHSYFNLKGAGDGDVLGYELQLNADRYTPVDATLIPTGELRSVQGTVFDFEKPVAIGARIDTKDDQLIFGKGYDHNFVLTGADGTLRKAARVHEPSSGRVMEIWTTEPNHPQFPSTVLKPGETYHSLTSYRFGVD
jgi:aldose 1-epimerase